MVRYYAVPISGRRSKIKNRGFPLWAKKPLFLCVQHFIVKIDYKYINKSR